MPGIIGPAKKCDLFFIIGTGRSGTTLLAQVMNAHSRVCVPHELQIVFEYSDNGARLAEIFDYWKNLKFRAHDYIELIEERCPYNFQDYYDYRAFFNRLHYPILSLRWLLRTLYADIACSQGKTIFAEQTPWYGQNIGLLNRLFPRAKFVHVLRDGRDVAISYARTPWWHKDVHLNLERWEREVNKIELDGARLLGRRMLTLRYEDFVSSPEQLANAVCVFLGIPFEKTMLDLKHHIDYRRLAKYDGTGISSSAYEQWQNEKTAAFFSSSVYAWKSNDEVRFDGISQAVVQTLKRFGYEIQ